MTSRSFAVVTGASSGIGRDAVRIDLAADGGVDDLYERIRALGRPVDAIALNAGIGAGGAFADMLDTKVGASDKDDPADVARQGFEAMMARDDRVVAGSLKTKLQGKASRFVPDAAKSAMHRDMAEPGSGR